MSGIERKNNTGRAVGGILVGVKKSLAIEEKISVGERVITLRLRMKYEVLYGGREWGEEKTEQEGKMKSQDKKVNTVGMQILKVTEDMGWFTVNRNLDGNEGGDYTYVKAKDGRDKKYGSGRESGLGSLPTDSGGKRERESKVKGRKRIDGRRQR